MEIQRKSLFVTYSSYMDYFIHLIFIDNEGNKHYVTKGEYNDKLNCLYINVPYGKNLKIEYNFNN